MKRCPTCGYTLEPEDDPRFDHHLCAVRVGRTCRHLVPVAWAMLCLLRARLGHVISDDQMFNLIWPLSPEEGYPNK